MTPVHNGSVARRDPYLSGAGDAADTLIAICGCYASPPPHVPRWPAAPNTP